MSEHPELPDYAWETEGDRGADAIMALEQKVATLQQENEMLMNVIRDSNRMVSEICEVIGAGDDDSPVTVAKMRMEEIRNLENECEALRDALEPFDGIDGGDDTRGYDDSRAVIVQFGEHRDYTLKLGHLRRATAALIEARGEAS